VTRDLDNAVNLSWHLFDLLKWILLML